MNAENSTEEIKTAAQAKSTLDEQQTTEWRKRILNSKFFNNNSVESKEKWGYDLYPERKQIFKPTISKILRMEEGREQFDKIRCEENVYECAKSSPLVKIMIGALKSAGWWVDIDSFY